MPRITVIIAAYNCSHTLKCALASLCHQTYTDFEAWVVGDCCTDDSEQVVASFGDMRLNWTNLAQRVGSQSGPNNEGLRRARGEFIAYLGQDDLWFPWHLESLAATMEKKNADFVHAVLAVLAPTLPAQGLGVPDGWRSYGARFVPPSGWLHKRRIVESCGPWPLPKGPIRGVDFAFQRRAFLAGCRFAGTGQLSVLKFPSPHWRTYARCMGFPQADYLIRMQSNPSELHTQLLTELLVASLQRVEELSNRPSLRVFLRAVYWRLVNWYDVDRWPFSTFYKWRHRDAPRRIAALRGLPPYHSDAAPAENRAKKNQPIV